MAEKSKQSGSNSKKKGQQNSTNVSQQFGFANSAAQELTVYEILYYNYTYIVTKGKIMLNKQNSSSICLAALLFLFGCRSRPSQSDQKGFFEEQLDDISLLGDLSDPASIDAAIDKAKKEGCKVQRNTLIGKYRDLVTAEWFKLSKDYTVEQTYKVVLSQNAPFCFETQNKNNNDNTFPKVFEGVFWMDGNPVPDVLLTLSNASVKDGQVSIKIWEPNNWSWAGGPFYSNGAPAEVATTTDEGSTPNDSIDRDQSINLTQKPWPRGAGVLLHTLVTKTKLIYSFNAKEYEQTGETRIFPFKGLLQQLSTKIVDFRFAKMPQNPGDSESESIIRRVSKFGKNSVPDYRFTRIINGNGEIDRANFANYLRAMVKKKQVYQLIYQGRPDR